MAVLAEAANVAAGKSDSLRRCTVDFFVQALRENPELAVFLTLAVGFLIGWLKIGSSSLGTVVGMLLEGVLLTVIGYFAMLLS